MSESSAIQPVKYVTHACAWLLACAGVLAVDFMISLAAGLAIGVLGAMGDTFLPVRLDEDQLVNVMQVVMQVMAFTVALIWFSCLRGKRDSGKTFSRRREASCRLGRSAGAIASRVALVIAAGFALQVFIGFASDAVLAYFPDVARDYAELMDDAGMNEIALLPVLATVIGAPVSEELMIRGVLFEFALRAFNQERGATPGMRSRGFWAANIVQAAAFGIMHMNIVQGCYAFVAGLALGWVFYRTGRVRYSILLHFAFNAGSYLMGVLGFIQTPLQVTLALIVSGVALIALLRRFDRELDEGQTRHPAAAR